MTAEPTTEPTTGPATGPATGPTPGIEIVLDAHATIGESPTWVPDERALYWIDVKAPALHCLYPDTGRQRHWRLPSDIGAYALTDDGQALVALRDGLFLLHLEFGTLRPVAPPPFDPALFRFNEGLCDAAGRFWVGVMFDPLDKRHPSQPGRLHSFTFGQGLREEPDADDLHNGMAWSADGRTFYLAHSYKQEIVAFDYDPTDGSLANRRRFATVPKELGIPDGGVIDTAGGYWSALHKGDRLRRFHPDGRVDRDILMPVNQPTMAVFAGDHLSTMFVTSASDNMTPEQHAREPHAGALFRLDPGARGIPRPFIVR